MVDYRSSRRALDAVFLCGLVLAWIALNEIRLGSTGAVRIRLHCLVGPEDRPELIAARPGCMNERRQRLAPVAGGVHI